jgi:hypothetical protein
MTRSRVARIEAVNRLVERSKNLVYGINAAPRLLVATGNADDAVEPTIPIGGRFEERSYAMIVLGCFHFFASIQPVDNLRRPMAKTSVAHANCMAVIGHHRHSAVQLQDAIRPSQEPVIASDNPAL